MELYIAGPDGSGYTSAAGMQVSNSLPNYSGGTRDITSWVHFTCDCIQGPYSFGDVTQVTSPPQCGDERGSIIQEYALGGSGYPPVNWTPGCEDFASGGSSTNFSWSELNRSPGSGHPPYGIVKIWDQLEGTRANHGGVPITVTSGYRCPHGNKLITPAGADQSRHMWGDAADMKTSNWSFAEWDSLREDAIAAGFTWWEPYEWDPSHLHVDKR